jgi:hypothetical protein
MHPAYFETHFDAHGFAGPWPREFVIITACATTGEQRRLSENETANRQLDQELERLNVWRQPVTGFSPSTGHAEPGWAVELPYPDACDLGLKFHQDAIYHVSENDLTVSHCDERRQKIPVGTFQERLRRMPGP